MAVHGFDVHEDVIVAIRTRRGEGRRALANRAGISYKHLHGIEAGRHRVSLMVLTALADALAVPVERIRRDQPRVRPLGAEEDDQPDGRQPSPQREANPTTHPEPTRPVPPPPSGPRSPRRVVSNVSAA